MPRVSVDDLFTGNVSIERNHINSVYSRNRSYFVSYLGNHLGVSWFSIHERINNPFVPMFLYSNPSEAQTILAHPLNNFITRTQRSFHNSIMDAVPNDWTVLNPTDVHHNANIGVSPASAWTSLSAAIPRTNVNYLSIMQNAFPTYWNQRGQRLERYNRNLHYVISFRGYSLIIRVPCSVTNTSQTPTISLNINDMLFWNGTLQYPLDFEVTDLLNLIQRRFSVTNVRNNKLSVPTEDAEEAEEINVLESYRSMWRFILSPT